MAAISEDFLWRQSRIEWQRLQRRLGYSGDTVISRQCDKRGCVAKTGLLPEHRVWSNSVLGGVGNNSATVD